MRYRYLILILVIFPMVEVLGANQLENKNGPLWGLGIKATEYTYPINFSGTTKKKVDDSASVFGPILSLGYNFCVQHLVLGLRVEGSSSENFRTGSHKSSTKEDHLNGKILTGSVLGRLGWVYSFQMNNPVGDQLELLGEFFIEGGLTKGRNIFTKDYSYSAENQNESYQEKLEESFRGRVLGLGFNSTMKSGAFFEIKISQTSMLSNKQTFTGHQSVGGTVSSLNQKRNDSGLSKLNSVMIILGKQY